MPYFDLMFVIILFITYSIQRKKNNIIVGNLLCYTNWNTIKAKSDIMSLLFVYII